MEISYQKIVCVRSVHMRNDVTHCWNESTCVCSDTFWDINWQIFRRNTILRFEIFSLAGAV
jgi:hypothetical protein